MKTAVITGSSTGIGLATALALGRAGHRVFGTMRNPERAPELAETAAREGLKISVLSMDVDDDASVARGFSEVITQAGRIDVLVNNAGVSDGGPVEETPIETFRAVMETNFFGVVRCTKAILPTMREQGSGCIVNISSVSGKVASAPTSPYAASKFAVEAFSEALAQEVGALGVRVAIVQPGVIQTPIFDKQPEVRADSRYPHQWRMKALFDVSLSNPVPPSIVGDQVVEIVDGDSKQLRYPVGPDAAPYMAWRAAISDEQFVALGAMDDPQWTDYVRNTFGMDVKL